MKALLLVTQLVLAEPLSFAPAIHAESWRKEVESEKCEQLAEVYRARPWAAEIAAAEKARDFQKVQHLMALSGRIHVVAYCLYE